MALKGIYRYRCRRDPGKLNKTFCYTYASRPSSEHPLVRGVDSHFQRVVLATITDETTAIQQVSERPIKCQSRSWSQRGAKVNGSTWWQHGTQTNRDPVRDKILTMSNHSRTSEAYHSSKTMPLSTNYSFYCLSAVNISESELEVKEKTLMCYPAHPLLFGGGDVPIAVCA